MRKQKRDRRRYLSRIAIFNFKRYIRHKNKKHARKIGWLKYINDLKANCLENNLPFVIPYFDRRGYNKYVSPKPEYSSTIQYLSSNENAFGEFKLQKEEDGYFEIPDIFSLTEDYSKSYAFLKRLFQVLHKQSVPKITFDYQNCKRIDVDASVCMDILLREFIRYYKSCKARGYPVKIVTIIPINYAEPHIEKILFSIGAYSTVKGISINFPDILPYHLCIADNKHPNAPAIREVDITKMVDYVLQSMKKMNKTLTPDAEDNLFKVIGEVLINAEEHSSGRTRYSIGYFQDKNENGEHLGIFNLVILNFGQTIYEKFKSPDCPNKEVVKQMKSLSKAYTERHIFKKAEFEEETLWTLYSLQEGVTSKADWKRGNGSIRFIESFFELKGGQTKDNLSYLSIVSGNTRITFDGTYRTKELIKGKSQKPYKMMTFNDTGNISEKPDRKYVNFADSYFPGTIISAKIYIKEANTEIQMYE